jgi:tripartite-type tricarboxylate transporter receptor subunit TctC
MKGIPLWKDDRIPTVETDMHRLPALLASFLGLACAMPAAAQTYPSRPIKAITSVGPGGTSDIFIRLVGDELHKRWGQPVIVEMRPGGNQTIGGRSCAEAANDGYTLCILPGETLSYNKFLYRKLPYDPESFEPITNAFFNTQVLVVQGSLKVKTLDELAALSKARSKTLSYVAPGAPHALFMEKWKAASGADLVRVPFRAGTEAVNGVMSGVTPVAFFGIANWLPHIREGTVVALAVEGPQRSPLLPDVPTLAELGYRGNLTRVYFGLLAPAGTPRPIVEKIHADVVRIGNTSAFRQKQFVDRALEPILNTPEEFARFLVADRAMSGRVVKEAGLQPQ